MNTTSIKLCAMRILKHRNASKLNEWYKYYQSSINEAIDYHLSHKCFGRTAEIVIPRMNHKTFHINCNGDMMRKLKAEKIINELEYNGFKAYNVSYKYIQKRVKESFPMNFIYPVTYTTDLVLVFQEKE